MECRDGRAELRALGGLTGTASFGVRSELAFSERTLIGIAKLDDGIPLTGIARFDHPQSKRRISIVSWIW